MQSLQMRWPVAAAIGLSMVTMASAPMRLPRALTTFISEIFSSSGQPASVTPKTLFWKAPVFLSFRPVEQLSLPWLMAPDAVVRLVERACEIGAGIGEGEAFALAPVLLRQMQHGDAVLHHRLDRHEMRHVELVRHLEEHARAMLARVLPARASPRRRSAAARSSAASCSASASIQRATWRRIALLGERLAASALRARAPAPRRRARRPASGVTPFTARRCTKSRFTE